MGLCDYVNRFANVHCDSQTDSDTDVNGFLQVELFENPCFRQAIYKCKYLQ